MANKYAYLAELDRFGYDLRVIETSEKKAKDAMIAEYIRAFEKINGFHPADEESDRGYSDEYTTWLDDAINDIVVSRMPIGKVEWR